MRRKTLTRGKPKYSPISDFSAKGRLANRTLFATKPRKQSGTVIEIPGQWLKGVAVVVGDAAT